MFVTQFDFLLFLHIAYSRPVYCCIWLRFKLYTAHYYVNVSVNLYSA